MPDTSELKDRIKKARKNKNITQTQLGAALGVSQAMIGQYESGKRKPKLEQLSKIANALDVDVNYLLEDTDSPVIKAMKSRNFPLLEDYVQHKLTENIKFESIDIELIKIFHKLNQKGKEKVIDYTSDLYNNSDYNDDTKGAL